MSSRDDALLRLLDFGLPDELSENQLRELGFREPARVKEGLNALRLRVDIARLVEVHRADLLRALLLSSDPDAAFVGLERWLEAGGATVCTQGQWCTDPFLSTLCAVMANTPALGEYLIRLPARTLPVLTPVIERTVAGGASWYRDLRTSVLEEQEHAKRLAALRRGRTEAMLQIAALDLCGTTKLRDTVRALSDLADACLQVALEIAVEKLRPQYGTARSITRPEKPDGFAPPPFTVLAMGKLGGRELNYSSDIDLIFAYSGEGQTEGGTRPVPYAEYFTKLSEEFMGTLARDTEDGRVYRVDMRLRPYGSAGPLVQSIEQTLTYLHNEGRTWERQAWLKARVAAGDRGLGEAMLIEASPFVFQRYLSIDAIGAIQGLKRQIEHDVMRRGLSREEVKLGRGGIRDIEFTVQFLQLLHGGHQPLVREVNTLRALERLRDQQQLTQREAETLEQAYLFHRDVEHRIQLHGDRQTHQLPTDPRARNRIAQSLGFKPRKGDATPPEVLFERERERHVERVRSVFESLFARLFPERTGVEGELSEALLAPHPDPALVAQLLPPFGLNATVENARALLDLAEDKALFTNPARTRRFFASLAPPLLKALVETGDPNASLRRFSRIAGSLGGKAIFYQSLNENPWLLRMTAKLAAWSEYLTDILVANPGLFDELVDSLRTGQSKDEERLEEELSAVAQGGDIGDTLRAYRAGEILRIGVRDLFHQVPMDQTQGELSDLAAAILRAQLRATRKAQLESRGEPRTADGRPIGFAVLAVGKFGGRELNYGSDLDVLFFYDNEGETADGLPAGPYFMELAQDLSRTLGTATSLGSLYEIDARLRPNGSKGPLATSLAAFEAYWKKGDLEDWERLALTRARFVAGDARTGERAEHKIRSAVYSPLQGKDVANHIRKMRDRLESTAEGRSLKRGRGGIVDIEFLVQYLQLIHGPAYPPVRQTNTRAGLTALVRLKKIEAPDGEELLEAYEFFGRIAQRLRVLQGLSANSLPDKDEELQKLALRAGYTDQGTAKNGSGETAKDAMGAKRGTAETTKNAMSAKSGTAETAKDAMGAKRGTAGTAMDAMSAKSGTAEAAGAQLLADYQRHTAEVRRLFEKYVVGEG